MNKYLNIHRSLLCTLTLLAGLLFCPVAWGQTNITALSEITDADGHYVITQDIDGGTSGVSTFNGTLEANINPTTHMPYRIKNLSAPLFTTLTGTVKNLVIENVSITGNTGNTGAVVCEASGAARIYNVGILGGTVGGTGYTGGLVGLLDHNETDNGARVINCYSFANITSGSVRAGIAGYNNYASKYNNLRTMVMNCMFYGNIDYSSGSVYPIYGGENISNDYGTKAPASSNRLNNYNYFLYEAPFSEGKHITAYNCALASEERFLIRFEFYRHLLNSTRELAAWYATGTATQSTMFKWVLDKSIAPYPILKEQGKYPSVVNYDTIYTYNSKTHAVEKRDTITTRNHGGKLGTLTVNISVGSGGPSAASIKTGKSQITLVRTDKDTANYNFNYDKVQLPYYNDVGTGNYTNNKVVTGWKITAMGGSGTSGGYTETNYDAPNYNYADRSTYGKDIYTTGAGNSGRVYSQGGYFNVPTGVTSITIEPYWGNAVYLSDACYDRYGYNNSDDLTQVGGGQRYTNNTDCPLLSGNQKVYTNITDALGALPTASSVYDNALVLVGNYHKGDGNELINDKTKPLTIMSVDLNEDNEPDYCFIFKSAKNKSVSHIRYDFITVPGMAMAHKMASSTDLAIPGNCCPQGWFEITTTGLIKFGQFEHSHQSKTLSPLILMGGVIEQFVGNNTATSADAQAKTKYMLFGDNVWFKMLSNGCHMDKWFSPPLRPVSITGGEFEKLYLSGYFRPDAKPIINDNAECYIDGGKFGEVAGAGQAQIDGNVTWLINHADIENFYGGGINAAKPVTGNITTTIKNSYVDRFCGGPMFGDMPKAGSLTLTWATNKEGTTTSSQSKTISADRTVNTTASNCTFGTFFGAGYGGTSIYREQFYNVFQKLNYNEWNTKVNDTYKNSTRGYYVEGKGVKVNYEYEFFGGSSGNVHRLYLWYASFSLAQTNNVTSTLMDCTVLENFYGGGSLGAVSGSTTSTLTNCTVKGNVFGAGYSVNIPTVDIRDLRTNPGPFIPEPKYNESTGVYEKGGYPNNTTFTWGHATISNGNYALDGTTIKTNETLTGLGAVSGNVIITLKGNTEVTGNVYGGGDESTVAGSTTVQLQGSAKVLGNVYGGGNKGQVGGSSQVLIQDATTTP